MDLFNLLTNFGLGFYLEELMAGEDLSTKKPSKILGTGRPPDVLISLKE